MTRMSFFNKCLLNFMLSCSLVIKIFVVKIICKSIIHFHVFLNMKRNFSDNFIFKIFKFSIIIMQTEHFEVGSFAFCKAHFTFLQQNCRVVCILYLSVSNSNHLNWERKISHFFENFKCIVKIINHTSRNNDTNIVISALMAFLFISRIFWNKLKHFTVVDWKRKLNFSHCCRILLVQIFNEEYWIENVTS